MALTILSYRDTYFPGLIDSSLWKQVVNAFGVKLKFVGEGEVDQDPGALVVFDETGDIPLAEFTHPENATYVFGCTGMRNVQDLYPGAQSVRIETPRIRQNQGMFGCQAAALVLYDRERKAWL